MLIKMIFFFILGGGLLSTFCPRGQGREVVKCPRLSTRGGEGVEIGQNLVHVVIECPLVYLEIWKKMKDKNISILHLFHILVVLNNLRMSMWMSSHSMSRRREFSEIANLSGKKSKQSCPQRGFQSFAQTPDITSLFRHRLRPSWSRG